MMKDLLETYFGKYYQSTKEASVTSRMLIGRFALSDPKACADCNRLTPQVENSCDKIVLRCEAADQEIEIIELENFINNYANLKAIPSGKKCDLLFINDKKVVFCDMTCSQAKYIDPFRMSDGTEKIGKRNIVRRQIENSITLLNNVPEIEDALQTRTSKIALFAYREKPKVPKDDFDAKVSTKMKTLDIMHSSIAKIPMYSDMGNGFLFTEVRYPDIYTL